MPIAALSNLMSALVDGLFTTRRVTATGGQNREGTCVPYMSETIGGQVQDWLIRRILT